MGYVLGERQLVIRKENGLFGFKIKQFTGDIDTLRDMLYEFENNVSLIGVKLKEMGFDYSSLESLEILNT